MATYQHALARERNLLVKAETTYGTQVFPAATDAIKVLSGTVLGVPNIERKDRSDNRTTRSLQSRITGRQAPAEWTIESYLIPSGTAGTPPDAHELFKNALGAYTNVASTSDTYTLTDTQGAHGSLSIYDYASSTLGESVDGAVVQQLSIKGGGGDPPTVSFSGFAADHKTTGVTTLNGAASGSDITVDDIECLEVGSLVAIYEAADGTTLVDSNSGAGFQVSSISGSVATLNAAPTGTADADFVRPFVPTATTAGSPTPGVLGTLTLAAVAFPALTYEITLANNHAPFDNEALQSLVTGYLEGYRSVTGQFSLRARRDQVQWLGLRKSLGTHAISLALGSGAGCICTITLPTVELGFAQVERGYEDSAIITLPFTALGTANELQIQFT